MMDDPTLINAAMDIMKKVSNQHFDNSKLGDALYAWDKQMQVKADECRRLLSDMLNISGYRRFDTHTLEKLED